MRASVLPLAAAVLCGCTATHQVTQTVANALLPPDQEAQLGRQVDAQVLAQTPSLADPEVQAYVEKLGERVAAPSAPRRALPVRFVVLDAPNEVNAFAVPGGTIFVYSGLLLATQDESALAGVLAHEVGHVTERHVAQQLVAQYGLQTLAAAALGRNPGIVAQLASTIAAQGLLLKYSRDQERQADEDAVRALAATGISADGLARFFLRLASEEGRTPAFLTYLQSHPDPASRAADVERLATELNAHRGETNSPQFAAVQGSLKTYYAARGIHVG